MLDRGEILRAAAGTFGQRYYAASLMRWAPPDPFDQACDLREGNRYVYAGADPTNVTDITGVYGTAGTPRRPG